MARCCVRMGGAVLRGEITERKTAPLEEVPWGPAAGAACSRGWRQDG